MPKTQNKTLCGICHKEFTSGSPFVNHMRCHNKKNSQEDQKLKRKQSAQKYRLSDKGILKIRNYTKQRIAGGFAKLAVQKHRDTIHGFLSSMYDDCKSSSKRRKLSMNLSRDFFLQQALFQDNKCFYSKLPLSFVARSDWQASPERLNRELGYVQGNVVLVCLEFNNFMQWSQEKIMNLTKNTLSYSQLDIEETASQILKVKKNKMYRGKAGERTREYDGFREKFCKKCDQWYKCVSKGNCKTCIQDYFNSPRGRCIRLICDAKKHANWRLSKDRKAAGVCNIKLEDIAQMFIKQRGKCFYSNTNLIFEGENKLSLERLDTSKGYTQDNCVLICVFFQGADHSVHGSLSRTGNGGWTKQKWIHVLFQNGLRN
jgi:hypothetical protein